jgi:phosphatidylserine/phosphatidylglycerophosphate/cardiolipin synthase-like enzyme/outer membrane protein OmpA-like peptidoglycan-associated protein
MRMFHENEMWPAGPAIAPLANSADAEVAGDPNVRWLQSALNQLLNAGLAVDGVPGPATRAAVRNFQTTNGLAADGIAGPATVAALRTALAGGNMPARPTARPVCTGLPVRQTLDRFAFGSHRLEPHHLPQIDAIAACLLASLDTSTPIEGLTIIGHTDPVGDDVANVALGQRRAASVVEALDASLRRQAPERRYSFLFAPTSAGERSTVPGDPALSRRVDILAPFAFPPPPKPKPGKTRPPKVDPPQTLRLDPPRWGPILSRAMGPRAALRTGNAVRHLIDAENTGNPALATYPAMIDAIKAAQGSDSFIYLLGWICIDQFDMINCDATTKFEKLLADAASRGVQIRALLWDQADPIANAQNRKTIERINKLPGGAAILDGRTLTLGSHHQKMLVVGNAEQLVAFNGGIDVNPDRVLPSLIVCPTPPAPRPRPAATEVENSEDDESSSGGGGKPLHDVHCRIEGPSAFDMLATFITRWDHHPDSRPIEARAPLRGRSSRIPGTMPGPLSPAQSSTGGTCSVVTARTFNPLRGSGLPRERDIKALLLAAIRNARRFIYMEEQYLLNLEAAAALRAALPQIEHLTIVIGASDISDLPCVWTYRREFMDTLTRGLAPELAPKVRVFQLATPPLPAVPPACSTKRKTFTPTFGRHTYVHAKCWVFDDELAVIGSANCNKRGWEHDSELNAFIFDDQRPPESAHSFAQQFRMDAWAEHLNVPPARVEDGVTSAALWLRPGVRAKVLPYCPNDGDDPALMPCSVIKDGLVDPPAP